MFKRLLARIEQLAAEQPVFLAFLVFVTATFIVIPVSFPFYLTNPDGFLENILGEAHGMLFDLLVIGWFGFWLTKLAERRRKQNRYREEIDDFLGWKSQEATHRIVGNIRRLNREGIAEHLRLTEAHLHGANLAGATLRQTDLWGANLERATLRESNLTGSNLAGAILNGADLERADLTRADLRGADLNEADLERALLDEADLRGALLAGADLQYAVLTRTNLERSTLAGANLRGCDLTGANLHGTDLSGAHLRGAALAGATLHQTNLSGADLLSTNLIGADLPEGEALLALFKDVKTLFGARFDPDVQQHLQEAYPHRFELADPRGEAAARPSSPEPPGYASSLAASDG
ncbi:MAG: pentapeptide repeat-containing protein [Rhodothermales bacterium]|nr:pentapeptide repeat-containing protein [Rhodothermales bacterium]